jgi:16S rRNA (guanine527-N7)-methyltransferase
VLSSDARDLLLEVLRGAQERGFVGPGPVAFHVLHAEVLAGTVGSGFAGRFLDLGSGAGIPGLGLGLAWPNATATLLESQRRRCWFLEEALRELGLATRVGVACGRAEELARSPGFRGRYDVVVARGFGSPAVTAECAVGFLRTGGRVAVSEPPGDGSRTRWPADGLAELGLRGPELAGDSNARFAILTLANPVSDRWPRGVGVPAKRPLWP